MKTSFFLAIWSVDRVPQETEKEGFWICCAALGVSRFWWLDWFCSISGRCGSAGFAVAVSFAFLLRFLLLLCLDFALFTDTQGDSLSCIGDTPFTHSDICSCKLVEVTGTHSPSFGFWSSLLISRMAVKRLLFSSRSELASCFKMVWWDWQLLQFVLKIFVLILQWWPAHLHKTRSLQI